MSLTDIDRGFVEMITCHLYYWSQTEIPYLSSLVFTSDWGRESAYGSIGVVVSGAITSTKPESQELECFQFLPILLFYSVTYDIAKTKLSEFEAEAEEWTSENANSQGPCNWFSIFSLGIAFGARSFHQIHFQAGCHKESGTLFLLDHNALLYWLTPRL